MIKNEVIILPINTDHKGNTFKSQAAMLSYYNVSKKTFQTRKSKNWTLEECLLGKTTPHPVKTKKITILKYTDHTRQKFETIKEMR